MGMGADRSLPALEMPRCVCVCEGERFGRVDLGKGEVGSWDLLRSLSFYGLLENSCIITFGVSMMDVCEVSYGSQRNGSVMKYYYEV